ncbi:DUF2155 domain-containing protein [Qipengyuania gelatinilytica]|uniref:DUF2155 domain-containing protein n=1 Tax=Qipengyuania gelatinilytica TaxID=2867231 RepID=A0ABX9AAN1_9SPHN|nr:DUF2155 domain-containing protein [Qipengyuania gelatinilytica]QZD96258.1 DUF2155 domain-containing protein [Qipengyuania gelatinilytica]
MLRAGALLAGVALLAACSDNPDDPTAPAPVETEIPEELQSAGPPAIVAEEAGIGTPMEERVATIGLLNKRNNLSQDLELKPGEQQRVGDVIVRVSACERTAPWEYDKDEGAFVQLLVLERGSESDFRKVFSGWLYKNKPSINVVEHPIYDVWVKACAMEYPGEE